MSEEELQQLPKAALIGIILQQQALIEELQARIAQLEEQLGRLTRPPKDSSNSSVPPSKTPKPNRHDSKGRKKRGPKPGHKGHSRKRQRPDLIVECRPTTCDRCDTSLLQTGGRLVARNQVVEIPPVRPVVIEALRYECICPQCGERQVGAPPAGLEGHRVFGPHLEALVCYLHHVHHMSYQRLTVVLNELFSLHLSQGAIANIIRRTASVLQPHAQAILEQIRRSPVIGCDETGARVDGTTQWQWVLTTPQATYHTIVPSRAGQVIHNLMGDAVAQVWVSDCYSAQVNAPAKAHQLCHAHQLRDLQYVIDAEQSAFAHWMQSLFLRAQRLAKHRNYLSPQRFAHQVTQIHATCDQLLTAPASGQHGRRLQKRYHKHRQAIFTFLDRPDVPPDNNAAERALRPSVVHRKVSGGFRSDWGAAAYATIASVTETAQKRGRHVLPTLTSLLLPGPPLPTLARAP
jgi:transposase